MIDKIFALILSLSLCVQSFAGNRVKKVTVAVDELAVVYTAVGIATIIQLPEPVASVIIGDQGAFKVEYLDKAITIKPLRFGAKTNLYITTPSRRYNVRLSTQSQDASDYVVYLAPLVSKEKSLVTWRNFQRVTSANGLSFEAKRVGKTKDGFILIEFSLKSKETQKINPEWFYLLQGENSKIIHSLFMSSADLSEKSPIRVVITLNSADLATEIPVVITLKYRLHELKLELSREVLWRK